MGRGYPSVATCKPPWGVSWIGPQADAYLRHDLERVTLQQDGPGCGQDGPPTARTRRVQCLQVSPGAKSRQRLLLTILAALVTLLMLGVAYHRGKECGAWETRGQKLPRNKPVACWHIPGSR